jgi:restriction endonuclease S subunit
MADIGNIPLLEPSLEDQSQIVDYLEVQLQRLDQLSQKATHAILLMQERRSALISAAVTGKIDVRDWTPPKLQPKERLRHDR